MKIKQEHYSFMRDAIATLGSKIPQIREAIRQSGKFNDLEKRLRWDLCYSAIPSRWICDNLYGYANDEHIDTALRRIVSEVEGRATA